MQRLFQAVWVLLGALFMVVGMSAAGAAESKVTLLKGVDLPGFDYDVRKGVDLDACQSACTDDRICRAFTFNQKAGWCFLKSSSAEQQSFKGAISGKVVPVPAPEVTAAVRQAEIPFPAQDLVDGARYLASTLATTDVAPKDVGYYDLVASGDEAVGQGNAAAALVPYRQALGLNGNDPELWLKLGRAEIERAEATAGQSESYDFAVTATYAAINALLQTEDRMQRAESLSLLARALERREMWRESIATYRASIGLVDDPTLVARLDKVVAEHGFRVVSNQVDSEAATPRICAVFSEDLPGGDTDMSQYVVVADAPQVAVETQDSQICLTGVDFGKRYNIKLRSGLPSASGEELRADVNLTVFVPDRTPFVGFANTAYVMPARLGGGLPITSVNAETAEISIYRIGDRSIATAVRNGLFQRTLDGYSAEDVANQSGEKVWEGEVDLAHAAPNVMTTTAVPVNDVLTDRQPGAYVITAKVKGSNQEYWRDMATQWFIVTDLGITDVQGEDGVHAFVRSLSDAKPVADATVRLVALNNEILGETRTDADGRADFAVGLARGEGGRAPQLLVVETAAGDYSFLDVSKPAFDLTDRGVEGRASPGPLDVFTTTERGVYRPSEFVYVTSLVRDSKAQAVTGLPMTMVVQRPDGVVAETQLLSDQGAGSYFAEIALPGDAMRGSWQVAFYADPDDAALSNTSFLVEDFEPERLAFEVKAPDAPLVPGEVTEVDVMAKYLYGATAPGLDVEADALIRPLASLADFPGYTFGRTDDSTESQFEPLGVVGTTDEDGNAVAEVVLPEPDYSTRPMEARINLRLVDSNGRTIQRSIVRPVQSDTTRIGVRPGFADASALGDGRAASFDLITVSPEGEMVATEGLNWRLSRIETNYQWYRDSGVWRWEAVTTTREVANGSIDTAADGPVSVSSPLQWGRYLFEVETSGDDAAATSYQFYAGYYYPEAGSDTPDTLQVALDKPAYRAGETAVLQLDPQFAGTALVMVVDDSIIDIKSVEVPAEGTSVELPVTDAWGPGAYVTAILYRPSDAAEKRMPARALGLAYADVDPGDMKLNVNLDVPEVNSPRAPLEVKVKIDGAKPGDKAYVAVAAVDLGILNITGFKTPDPDGWYFGQRQLGVEFRDLYGQLIDPTQGMPGAMRSGGDGSGGSNGSPPPTTVLVAQHSGIVEVGEDGTATVTFDMPDFNGTVRLMAMAWTAAAVGHAEKDVFVRDPVVVNLSPPRFMRLDDTSRLLVEVNNVGGQPGDYSVELVTGDGLSSTAEKSTQTLAVGERMSLDLDLTATAIGDNALKVLVTGPGTSLIKELTLGVRAASGPRTTSRLVPIGPGETITIDKSYVEGLIPNSGDLTAAVGPVARLDVPSLLLSLDRYPYGCAEQVSSRAFPLIYLNEVAQRIGMGGDDAIDKRVQDAISNLLTKQSSNGSFGLWDPFSASDMWLDSYVTDFLLHAKAEGYDVPEQALSRALDSLGNQVSYATDFSSGGEDIAYALYDLARAGRAAIGDLRYYLEAKLDAFSTPLAKAQIGAALALYGDRARAAEAFAAAVDTLQSWKEDKYSYRSDYGSKLRDAAAVLALAAEFTPSGVDLSELASLLSDLRDANRYTSTQEDAWTLIAAAALARETADGSVTVDGETLSGSVYLHYGQDQIEAADVSITNSGNRPTEAKISVTGIPAVPPPASSEGFSIDKAYYTPTGEPITAEEAAQNDRFVVVLTARPAALGSGQYMIVDPLPAGFEIENPDLLQGSGIADLSWLTVDRPVHFEARTEQYVAAFRFTTKPETVTTAYLARAVTPGSFVLPGATVEDMYRPELRGNSETGHIEIAASGP